MAAVRSPRAGLNARLPASGFALIRCAGRWHFPAGRPYPLHGMDEPCCRLIASFSERVSALDRCQRPACAYVKGRDSAVIEANRDQPWQVRSASPQLIDGNSKFFILIGR
jgi:hypothetical protein